MKKKNTPITLFSHSTSNEFYINWIETFFFVLKWNTLYLLTVEGIFIYPHECWIEHMFSSSKIKGINSLCDTHREKRKRGHLVTHHNESNEKTDSTHFCSFNFRNSLRFRCVCESSFISILLMLELYSLK